MKQLYNYFVDSTNELKLVTWPKQEETVRFTIITVIFVLVSALLLGALDFAFSFSYSWFLTLGA